MNRRRCPEHSKKIKLEQFDPAEIEGEENVLMAKEDCKVEKKGR